MLRVFRQRAEFWGDPWYAAQVHLPEFRVGTTKQGLKINLLELSA